MKQLSNMIVISISSFKIYEDVDKLYLQRMSNKGKPFSPTGRDIPCSVFSGLGKEVFWGGTGCKLCRTAIPALRSPAAVPWHPQCSRARNSKLAWLENLFVFICIWWWSASVEETAELCSAPGCSTSFQGGSFSVFKGSLGTVYWLHTVRWKIDLGAGSVWSPSPARARQVRQLEKEDFVLWCKSPMWLLVLCREYCRYTNY